MSEDEKLNIVQCPNCPDQGWYALPDPNTGEPMQVQCEFCYTVDNSVFNYNHGNFNPTPDNQ